MKHLYNAKSILAIFCFLIVIGTLNAQNGNKKFRFKEVLLNSFVSGNSFGVQRNPSVSFLAGKRLEFAAGPTFNRGFQKNTGELISTRYYFIRDNESYNGHFLLASVFSFHRMHNQSLSKGVIELEQQMAFNMKNDESAPFHQLSYKGWELAAGIGCAYRCSFGMIVRAEAALCYYETQLQTHLEINTFHEERGTSLRLGFAIGWTISKKPSPVLTLNESL